MVHIRRNPDSEQRGTHDPTPASELRTSPRMVRSVATAAMAVTAGGLEVMTPLAHSPTGKKAAVATVAGAAEEETGPGKQAAVATGAGAMALVALEVAVAAAAEAAGTVTVAVTG